MPSRQSLSDKRITRSKRRGMALYVSVMMTALLVSLLGLAGIAVVRIERIETESTNDLLRARLNARSVVDFAMATMNYDPNWRSTYTSGVETIQYPLGSSELGTFSWIVTDSDGDLTDSDTSLTIQGIGRVGDAVQVVEAELSVEKLTCLGVSMHSEDELKIEHSVLDNDHIISSNDRVKETGGSEVNGDVEAVDSIDGGDYTGTLTEGITPKTTPGSDVFDYYLANGTEIPFDSLDNGKLENTLLSPEYNPFGATNPQGIYFIQCNHEKIEIKKSFIVGTIVLIDPKHDSEIGKDQIYWQPAVANYPSLLASDSITIKVQGGDGLLNDVDTGGSDLSGSVLEQVINEVGIALPVGDATEIDGLPSELNGLFYSTGDISIEHKQLKITGVIISGGKLDIKEDTEITYSSTFHDSPPPGFQTDELKPVSDTWTRAAAP